MFQGKNKDDKLKLARNLFSEAISADRKFIKEAMEDFEFRDGNQWTDDERSQLAADLRPCLTFPLVKSRVDLVMGLREDSKVKYVATPRAKNHDFLCEVINDTVEYVYQKAGAEEVEDETFESAAICGRGWISVSFVPDPKRLGHIKIEFNNHPIYEVRKDPNSRKGDLSDAAYLFLDKWMSVEDFKVHFPKQVGHIKKVLKDGYMLGDSIFGGEELAGFEEEIDEDTKDYDTPLDTTFFNKSKNQVRVVQLEYWQSYLKYYAFNPEDGKPVEFQWANKKELEALYREEYGIPFEYTSIRDKKVGWIQFLGDKIIYDGDSPVPFDGFSPVPCFAYSDASKRSTNNYGVVRLMKDSQREVNKRWSQALNMINNNVQPGVIVEEDTFVDDEQGEASLKEVGGVTFVKEGAIKDKRIEVRNPPPFPVAAMQMEEAAKDMINQVTNINPDLMGQDRGRVDSGVVVRLRQNQGIATLKTLMAGSKHMKKAVFERVVPIILEYMPDEQIIDILSDSNRYEIQGNMVIDKETELSADIRDVRNVKYNIIPEEMPASKGRRLMELSVFLEMQGAGMPVDPNVIIDKLDISASEKKQWKNFLQAQQEAAEKARQEELELERMKIQAKMYSDSQRVSAGQETGFAKLSEAQRKGDMQDAVDRGKLRLVDQGQKLDFIAKTQKPPPEKAKTATTKKAK